MKVAEILMHMVGIVEAGFDGVYQFATKPGTAQAFVNWLKEHNTSYCNRLSMFSPGTEGFRKAWHSIASEDPKGFYQLQHDYAKVLFYDVAVRSLEKKGISVSNRSEVFKDVIWSTAIQYGPGYVRELVETSAKRAGTTDPNKLDDAELIKNIYAIRRTPDVDKWYT